MSRSKEHDEQEALKLDEYFKETLERARPLILAFDKPKDSGLIRLWLKKLSCASSQRSLRNQYLFELCGHLKTGHIGGIFCTPPQTGPLEPLPRFSNPAIETSSSLSELSETSCNVPYEVPRPNTNHRHKMFSSNRSSDSSSTNRDRETKEPSALRYCDRPRTGRNPYSICKRRIESLTALVHNLQMEKEHLKRNLSYSKDNCDCEENTNSLNSTIGQLTMEITALRTRFAEVNEMKNELEKNHLEIVEQYKSTMTKDFNDLKSRLREAYGKNEELEERVRTIDKQFEKIMRETKDQLMEAEEYFKEKLEIAQLHCETQLATKDRELSLKEETIGEKDAELATREKFYRDEMILLNERIHMLEEKLEIKIDEENKLQSFLKEQCSTMKEEFMKMRSDMEVSTRTENQTLLDKISSLKKIILKLMRSKEKQSIEFERRITHVLKTKELEIKNLELQLQKQHNELSTTLSTEKQCELDGLVKLLEERYKALLAATDESIGNQRQNFLKKITFLESQMTCMKNNLVDNDLYV